jgi:hypothetical protein
MNATQAENLRILIRHMETKCNRTLDMDRYGSCGTPACAYGEACVLPHFNAQGLHLNDASPSLMRGEIFGEGGHVRRLFGGSGFNKWGRDAVTPQEWALEARKVLAENGYSMDDAKPIPTIRAHLDAIYAGQLDESQELDEDLSVKDVLRFYERKSL